MGVSQCRAQLAEVSHLCDPHNTQAYLGRADNCHDLCTAEEGFRELKTVKQ